MVRAVNMWGHSVLVDYDTGMTMRQHTRNTRLCFSRRDGKRRRLRQRVSRKNKPRARGGRTTWCRFREARDVLLRVSGFRGRGHLPQTLPEADNTSFALVARLRDYARDDDAAT